MKTIKDKNIEDLEFIKNLNLEEYFYENKLGDVIGVSQYTRPKSIGPNDTFNQEGGEVFSPDCADLARLHALVRIRKCLTVLELGSGVSTKVIADALSKNYDDYQKDIELVRRQNPFKLFSIESEEKYLETTRNSLGDLETFVEMLCVKARQDIFKNNICGRYMSMPSICPDFIYIDGPSPYSYSENEDAYLNISHPDITNVTCDLLLLEAYLLPGTFVIFDGMTNNARFNKRMLSRDWISYEDTLMDYTILTLVEDPLGVHHKNQISFIQK